MLHVLLPLLGQHSLKRDQACLGARVAAQHFARKSHCARQLSLLRYVQLGEDIRLELLNLLLLILSLFRLFSLDGPVLKPETDDALIEALVGLDQSDVVHF